MNRNGKTLLALALCALVAGCGLLSKATGGKSDAIAGDAEAKKREAEAKKREADAKTGGVKEVRKCEALRNPQVAIEEEYTIGQAIALNWIGKHGLIIDKGSDYKTPANDLGLYVNKIGKNLAAQSSRPNIQWTFGVINSDEFNAYSAPGGYVLVTKGLLKAVQSEAQLAGVIAHEIAHVTERHALRVYGNAKANGCQAALAAKAGTKSAGESKVGQEFAEFTSQFQGALGKPGGYVDLNNAGVGLITNLTKKVVEEITLKGFAHGDEFEADKIAAELITAAGYSPKEFVNFVVKIPAEGGAFKNHPKNDARRQKLLDWRGQKKAAAANDPLILDPDSKDLKPVVLKDELALVKK